MNLYGFCDFQSFCWKTHVTLVLSAGVNRNIGVCYRWMVLNEPCVNEEVNEKKLCLLCKV